MRAKSEYPPNFFDFFRTPHKVLDPTCKQLARAYTQGSSSITQLHFDEANLHPEVLRNILALPRALKKFTYWLCKLNQNAELFQQTLELQQKTLEFLSLNVWLKGGVLSLEKMKGLKILSIIVELLIHPPETKPKRILRDVLPESLEKLPLLDFHGWAGLAKENAFQRISSQLQGIAEPSDKFRALSKVTIMVPSFKKNKQAEIQWRNGFVELDELFKVARIDLVVGKRHD